MHRILFAILVFIVTLASCESQAKNIHIRSGRPMQEQLTDANAVYLITERINLNGATVIMPSNSTLRFKWQGLLTNGTLQGNGTHLTGKPRFDGMRLKGIYATQEFYASWSSARSISDYIEDVMNLGGESAVVVDCDITLNDQKKYVDHLNLKGKKKTITNSDRYYITYGGTSISDLKFRWDKGPVQEPKDNYSAVVIYWDLLQKDTTIITSIKNIQADGGRYCSYFMKQYKSSIEPKLRTNNLVENSSFENFTRGAIWTCGGTGEVTKCIFKNLGYETTSSLLSVCALRLGYSNKVGERAKAVGYVVSDCEFNNIVASYNHENDGRGLHGLLAYGDSINVVNNQFLTLSTSFSKPTDAGMDSEMLYIKGSYNTISKNRFENGAGSLSDGVVTLKIRETEGNVIQNNTFTQTSNNCTFIRLGGNNHKIIHNVIQNDYYDERNNPRYAIYIAYQNNIEGDRIVIQKNDLQFVPASNYMGIYANGIGELVIQHNRFVNTRKLIKNNKRIGKCVITDNTINTNCQKADISDSYIELSGGVEFDAIIRKNTFSIIDSHMGRLVTGSNYCFENNIVEITNSSFESFIRGKSTPIKVKDNIFSFDNNLQPRNVKIVGESETNKIKMSGNIISNKR